ncbi:MAG: thioredoxin-disulfide reductase [Bacteroidetes bacterium]|nr:thioredoxin-disulfide reductase [Bacteroidota bacterium]
MDNYNFDVIVIGGGPAGLTAGIYISRAKMKTLIINEGTAGGQMILTHEIANYPGVESTSGYELANIMKNQAKSFGCIIRSNVRITNLNFDGDIKTVEVNYKDIYSAPAIILATGGRSRSLGVPGEDDYKGKGISYCATCDGDFFQDKKIIVVGGGNSALEEAVSLTKYAASVTIIHQFDNFQAFPHAVEEAKKNPKINIIMESKIIEFLGEESLKKVYIQNQRTYEISEMNIDGVFIFIGYKPNTEMFKDKIELNQWDEIITKENLETNVPGVFAAGDSIKKRYRQITTAVADGTIAALSAVEYVNNLKVLSQA